MHPGEPEHARVELVAAGEHHVAAVGLGPALALDELAHLLRAITPPLSAFPWKLPALDELPGAVQRGPGAEFRDGVVLRVGELPNTGVLLCPDFGQVVEGVGEPLGGRVVKGVALAHVELRRLEQIAVAAQLKLAGGGIPAPDRT